VHEERLLDPCSTRLSSGVSSLQDSEHALSAAAWKGLMLWNSRSSEASSISSSKSASEGECEDSCSDSEFSNIDDTKVSNLSVQTRPERLLAPYTTTSSPSASSMQEEEHSLSAAAWKGLMLWDSRSSEGSSGSSSDSSSSNSSSDSEDTCSDGADSSSHDTRVCTISTDSTSLDDEMLTDNMTNEAAATSAGDVFPHAGSRPCTPGAEAAAAAASFTVAKPVRLHTMPDGEQSGFMLSAWKTVTDVINYLLPA
jgi:hypothetical protein